MVYIYRNWGRILPPTHARLKNDLVPKLGPIYHMTAKHKKTQPMSCGKHGQIRKSPLSRNVEKKMVETSGKKCLFKDFIFQ